MQVIVNVISGILGRRPRLSSVLVFFVFTALFTIAVNLSYDLLKLGYTHYIFPLLPLWANFVVVKTIFILLVIAMLLLLVWVVTRKSFALAPVKGKQRKKPKKTKVLILFLSPVKSGERDDTKLIDRILATPGNEQFNDNKTVSSFQGPWAMPLTAIEYHYAKLQTVVIIGSADPNKQKETGTYRKIDLFKKLMNALQGTDPGPEVIPLSEISNKKNSKGVDFNHAQKLVEALNTVYQFLIAEKKYSESDIMIDVTGGFKATTIAGAMVALERGRRFQCVSTINKEIISYAIEYNSND